jgi:ethanolamine utilization protein EutQ (cupin superfamily)
MMRSDDSGIDRRALISSLALLPALSGTLAQAQTPSASPPASAQQQLEGQVLVAGEPVAGATVTLWAARADAPAQLAQAQTGADGRFALNAPPAAGNGAVYLVAKGGSARTAANKGTDNAIALTVLLATPLPRTVTINELTTVASAFTAAQFMKGESISGNPLGLRIAAGNVPNLVDPATGRWGKVLLDPLNSTQTTTLVTLNTLGSLVTAFATGANDEWRARFLKAATLPGGTTPKNVLDAMAGIARTPWVQPKELFALFDEAYPQPKDGSRRNAPFVPYLAYVPDDFALSLCFAGGGVYSAGRLMFDAEGNLWSGQNWMAGSQSGVNQSIGGGVVKLSPNGAALSPPITGFTGMGIDGVGWGTAVTQDKVWLTSFNGKILVMDFNGRPVGTESDFPFKEKFLGLMGIGVAANGDVWIADGSDNQLLHFPGGRVKDGRTVKVAGLKSPFDIVIDAQNRVWVSNSQSDTVVRFAADNPSKVESFRVGIGVRALALDSKGNVWVASNMSLDFPPPVIPDGASIMEQFKIAAGHMLKVLSSNPHMVTGVVNLIRGDGSQPAPAGFTGDSAVSVPWGLNIDGNDDVWIGNFWGRGVVLMAGEATKGHPAGTKTGDAIHVFKGGSIQMLTDVSIDPAGNVWAANNWNDLNGAAAPDPLRPTSTWGGGSGITVIYGVAAPVQPPRMGIVRKL